MSLPALSLVSSLATLPRRSRSYPNAGTVSPTTTLALFLRDGCRCAYCGIRPRFLTLDHIVPRGDGGTSDPTNLLTSCGNCNSAKGGKSLTRFVANPVHRARIRRMARRPLNLELARTIRAAAKAAG